jgi:NAD(P)-dependent dehydrogenase (short-subunit alcohol dehydrogenase family)
MAEVAMVTGASRGIGKVCAVWLAKAGFDVAVTARTVEPGERGTNIEAQFLCAELGLLDGWDGPLDHENHIRYDESGTRLRELEASAPKLSAVRRDGR